MSTRLEIRWSFLQMRSPLPFKSCNLYLKTSTTVRETGVLIQGHLKPLEPSQHYCIVDFMGSPLLGPQYAERGMYFLLAYSKNETYYVMAMHIFFHQIVMIFFFNHILGLTKLKNGKKNYVSRNFFCPTFAWG